MRRIDVHHHFVPRAWIESRPEEIYRAINSRPSTVRDWTPERSLDEMDQNDIAAAMLSVTAPGVWFGDAAESRQLARACNEEGVELVRRHPGRFGVFAALPFPDVAGSIAEIDYAFDELGLMAIGLLTSYDDIWPGDPRVAPIFDALNERHAIVYFHPTEPACCAGNLADLPSSLVEFPFDTTRAILSLLFSGTIARCPDITWIFSHGGGTIPMLSGRIQSHSHARNEAIRERIKGDPASQLRSLYYDIVSVTSPPAMAALQAFVPPSQLLFGTDYPFRPASSTGDELLKLALPEDDVVAIERGNAVALLRDALNSEALR